MSIIAIFLALSRADQRAFIVDVVKAVHSRDRGRLQACLEDWQATVEALHNPALMNAWQPPAGGSAMVMERAWLSVYELPTIPT